MKCIICEEEAMFIYKGNSYCTKHFREDLGARK